MRRAPGWTRLAGIALELTALAFIGYVVTGRDDQRRGIVLRPTPEPAPAVQESQPEVLGEPVDFIAEPGDADARYYRAAAEGIELLAGFYSDGRMRLTDSQNRRFAGLLQGGQADLLQLDNNQWSEVFVRSAPDGTMQLELRGGPYDARVLTCEPLDELDKLSPSTSSEDEIV